MLTNYHPQNTAFATCAVKIFKCRHGAGCEMGYRDRSMFLQQTILQYKIQQTLLLSRYKRKLKR